MPFTTDLRHFHNEDLIRNKIFSEERLFGVNTIIDEINEGIRLYHEIQENYKKLFDARKYIHSETAKKEVAHLKEDPNDLTLQFWIQYSRANNKRALEVLQRHLDAMENIIFGLADRFDMLKELDEFPDQLAFYQFLTSTRGDHLSEQLIAEYEKLKEVRLAVVEEYNQKEEELKKKEKKLADPVQKQQENIEKVQPPQDPTVEVTIASTVPLKEAMKQGVGIFESLWYRSSKRAQFQQTTDSQASINNTFINTNINNSAFPSDNNQITNLFSNFRAIDLTITNQINDAKNQIVSNWFLSLFATARNSQLNAWIKVLETQRRELLKTKVKTAMQYIKRIHDGKIPEQNVYQLDEGLKQIPQDLAQFKFFPAFEVFDLETLQRIQQLDPKVFNNIKNLELSQLQNRKANRQNLNRGSLTSLDIQTIDTIEGLDLTTLKGLDSEVLDALRDLSANDLVALKKLHTDWKQTSAQWNDANKFRVQQEEAYKRSYLFLKKSFEHSLAIDNNNTIDIAGQIEEITKDSVQYALNLVHQSKSKKVWLKELETILREKLVEFAKVPDPNILPYVTLFGNEVLIADYGYALCQRLPLKDWLTDPFLSTHFLNPLLIEKQLGLITEHYRSNGLSQDLVNILKELQLLVDVDNGSYQQLIQEIAHKQATWNPLWHDLVESVGTEEQRRQNNFLLFKAILTQPNFESTPALNTCLANIFANLDQFKNTEHWKDVITVTRKFFETPMPLNNPQAWYWLKMAFVESPIEELIQPFANFSKKIMQHEISDEQAKLILTNIENREIKRAQSQIEYRGQIKDDINRQILELVRHKLSSFLKTLEDRAAYQEIAIIETFIYPLLGMAPSAKAPEYVIDPVHSKLLELPPRVLAFDQQLISYATQQYEQTRDGYMWKNGTQTISFAGDINYLEKSEIQALLFAERDRLLHPDQPQRPALSEEEIKLLKLPNIQQALQTSVAAHRLLQSLGTPDFPATNEHIFEVLRNLEQLEAEMTSRVHVGLLGKSQGNSFFSELSHQTKKRVTQREKDHWNAIINECQNAAQTATTLCRQGEAHLALSELTKAAECFSKAIEEDQNFAQAYYYRSLVYAHNPQHSNNFATAETDLGKAIEFAKNDPVLLVKSYQARAELYYSKVTQIQENPPEAGKQKPFMADKTINETEMFRFKTYTINDFNAALSTINKMIQSYPRNAEYYYLRAQLYLKVSACELLADFGPSIADNFFKFFGGTTDQATRATETFQKDLAEIQTLLLGNQQDARFKFAQQELTKLGQNAPKQPAEKPLSPNGNNSQAS